MAKSVYKNYIKAVIILAFVAYIIMFVYTFFVQDIETMVLKSGVVEEVNVADGVITRTEEVVTLNVKDELRPLVSSGDRVSKGQALAVIENEKVKSIEEEIDKLNEEIGNIAVPSSFSSAVKSLEDEINKLIKKIVTTKGYKSVDSISMYKNELNQKMQDKIIKIAEVDTNNVQANNYIAKKKEYESDLLKAQTTVESIMAGTVVYKLDGFEKILTTEKISDYTPEMLEGFNIPKGELIGTSKKNSFKIVDNLECYITVVLDTKEAEDAYVDQKVMLRFPEIDNTLEVTGVIDYINFTPRGTVISFKINKAIEKIINYRKTKLEIVWDSEEGYKVPKNAIAEENGKYKIYLYLGRNYIVEKYVEVKKEYNDFAIIAGAEGDKLYMYDSVILNASDVNLNKLLKY